MKTILCPTDFSKNAVNAVDYACALAEEFHSKLALVHVYETPATFTEMPYTSIVNADEAIRGAAEEKLNALKARIEKKYRNISVDKYVHVGAPADTISNFAKAQQADLIVMGTTGTTKLARLLMGSTTSRVIHIAPCPVLCIPKEAKFEGIQKIVFATDLHEDNISAALSILAFARHFNAEISFLFVDDKHLIHSDESIADMTQKIRKRVHYEKLSGYIAKNTNVTKGIEFFLKKYKAQVLVMLTHERHLPQSLFSQSVTTMMSHQTRIPLLALKAAAATLHHL